MSKPETGIGVELAVTRVMRLGIIWKELLGVA